MSDAIAKKNEYDKLANDYKDLAATETIKIATAEKEIVTIDDNIKNEEQLFTNYFNDGFLTRIEALNNLVKSNKNWSFHAGTQHAIERRHRPPCIRAVS